MASKHPPELARTPKEREKCVSFCIWRHKNSTFAKFGKKFMCFLQFEKIALHFQSLWVQRNGFRGAKKFLLFYRFGPMAVFLQF